VSKRLIQGVSVSGGWPMDDVMRQALLDGARTVLAGRVADMGHRLVTSDEMMEQVTWLWFYFENTDEDETHPVQCAQEQATCVTVQVERLTEVDE